MGGRMRVLIVEDEVRLARLIGHRLTAEGHAADIAVSGTEALDWAATAEFDAIILDVMLPDIDGLSVCRKLRSLRYQAPIVLLTARDTIDDRVAGLDAGADDYLVK